MYLSFGGLPCAASRLLSPYRPSPDKILTSDALPSFPDSVTALVARRPSSLPQPLPLPLTYCYSKQLASLDDAFSSTPLLHVTPSTNRLSFSVILFPTTNSYNALNNISGKEEA